MPCDAGGHFPVILQLLSMDRAICGRSFTQRWHLWQNTLNLWRKISKKMHADYGHQRELIIRMRRFGTVRETAAFWLSGTRRFRAGRLRRVFTTARNIPERTLTGLCRQRIRTAMCRAGMKSDTAAPWREWRREAGWETA